MSDTNLVRLGFAGRTNSGKTTTIRTLMRRAVGVVGDRPNVTQLVEELKDPENPHTNTHTGIQAIFVDCPGFQMASLSRHFINDFDTLLKMDKKAIYDARAIEALKKVDVVVYIANLEDVPNDDYVNEVEIIKALQKPCIILLNKFRKRSEEGSNQGAEDRANQWKIKMSQVSDYPMLLFDAHWKRPSSTREFYRLIKEALPQDRKILFEEGLKNFYKQQKEVRNDVSTAIVELILNCRKRVEIVGGEKKKVEKKLQKQVEEAFESFFSRISTIYKLSASQNADDDFSYNHSSRTDFWDVISTGATGAGGGAALGGAIGGAVGAVVGFFGGFGVGAGPGALAGAQIGATILGTIGGGGGGFLGIDQRHKGQVSEQYLKLVLDKSIGLAYAMASHGFGLGAHLRDEDIIAMVRKGHEIRESKFASINLINASRQEISELSQSLLKAMEN